MAVSHRIRRIIKQNLISAAAIMFINDFEVETGRDITPEEIEVAKKLLDTVAERWDVDSYYFG